MVIYIEYLFLDNMAVNLLVLYLAIVTLKETLSWKRIFLSAVIGTGFAFGLPFVGHFVFFYKCAAALVMNAVFRNKSVRAYLLRLAVFVAYSFFLGGIVGGLFHLRTDGVSGALVYDNRIVSTTLLGAVILFFVVRKLYLVRSEKKKKANFYRVCLTAGGFSGEFTAYYDSGNKLYDTDGKPVAVVGKTAAERIFLTHTPQFYMIEVKTVGGKSNLKAFKTDEFVIYLPNGVNKIENITAAVSEQSFKGFEILLHHDMFDGNEVES
ncbi:MAG: sigma-E processing peptidase SpoIIGA [Clostridiales bacterium]|jgi:sigma-E processing peptidase SpoIIGA|nr:sigma-E processing peptidase SpoIIGA [Clostridiales bacterium]